MSPRHICTPECHDLITEFGHDPAESDCDPEEARVAAELERGQA